MFKFSKIRDNNTPASVIGMDDDGSIWYDITDYMKEDSEFIHLGIAPRPRNKLEVFIWHMCNGLLMRYPLIDVLWFSITNLDSFFDNETVDAIENKKPPVGG